MMFAIREISLEDNSGYKLHNSNHEGYNYAIIQTIVITLQRKKGGVESCRKYGESMNVVTEGENCLLPLQFHGTEIRTTDAHNEQSKRNIIHTLM